MKRTAAATGGDLELQAHWGRYLCVLLAGFLENALSEVYSAFVYGTAGRPVASFAASRLLRIQNPRANTFVETARSFDAQWAVDLEAFLATDGRKEAIDSVMANRHQIAHGKSAGITVAQVSQHLQKCVEVVEFLEAQCGL